MGIFRVLGKDGAGGKAGRYAGAGEGNLEYPLPRANGQGFRGRFGRFIQEKAAAAAKKQGSRKKDGRNKAFIHPFPLYLFIQKYNLLV
jgi:hypothetical protein